MTRDSKINRLCVIKEPEPEFIAMPTFWLVPLPQKGLRQAKGDGPGYLWTYGLQQNIKEQGYKEAGLKKQVATSTNNSTPLKYSTWESRRNSSSLKLQKPATLPCPSNQLKDRVRASANLKEMPTLQAEVSRVSPIESRHRHTHHLHTTDQSVLNTHAPLLYKQTGGGGNLHQEGQLPCLLGGMSAG